MISSLKQQSKTRREYLHKLFSLLSSRIHAIAGATVTKVNPDILTIKVIKQQTDLQRFQDLASSSSFLYLKSANQIIPQGQTPQDESSGLLAQTTSDSGQFTVRFRKGVKNDKDVFIEVWNQTGFSSGLKVTDKMTKVYNDTVFGGFAWSADEKKIAFIAEVPEIASYKNPFEETKKPDPEKEESKDGSESKKEEAKEEYWQEDKFLYKNDFGEALTGKSLPAIFVFDLKANSLERLQGLTDDLYPQRPIFDEHSKGLLFSAVKLPIKKLGLNFCLNRPTHLYYVAEPIFDKKKLQADDSTYLRQINPASEYMAMHQKLSKDFKHLVYIGSEKQFLSHSGNYQLKHLPWPLDGQAPRTVIDRQPDYPTDAQDFAGLYGYQLTYTHSGFLHTSSRFYVLESEVKGLEKTYIVDLETNEVRSLSLAHVHGKQTGHYELLRRFEDTMVLKFSHTNQAPRVYTVRFLSVD